MNSATAYDRSLGQVLRFRNRQANPPAAARERGLFADMADGVIVAQHFCNFAGFEWAETKLFTTIVGLCGDGEKTVEMFDEELGQHARCTDRTIRSWRAAYLKKANTISFWPLDVREGENLRAMLLEMRGQIDGFLSGISQATEGIEVDDIPENSSGIPPGRSEGDEEAEAAEAEVQDRFREDQKNTRKRVDEAEHSPEDIAAMDEIIDRLRKPQVRRVEIPLRSPEEPEDADPPESHHQSGLPDEIRWSVGMSDEEYERQYAEWQRPQQAAPHPALE